MVFTSTFQLHQSFFFDSLQSSFSLRFAHLRSLQCSFSFNLKQRSLHSSKHLCIGRKPDCKIHFSAEISPAIPSWIKIWGEESRSRLLSKRPRAVLDYRVALSSDDEEFGTSACTGSSTMVKIVEKLKKYGYMDEANEGTERSLPEKGSVEDIFYAEDGILPNCRGGLSLDLTEIVRFPWEKPRDNVERKGNGGDSLQSVKFKTLLEEKALPQEELRRLTHMGIRSKSKTKIGSAGVTQEIVDAIREKWKISEVVSLKCQGEPALNMKRMHEILERNTGGQVIWRSGTSVVLYRGINYTSLNSAEEHYDGVRSNFDKLSNAFNLLEKCVKNIDVQSHNVKGFDLPVDGEHLNFFKKDSSIQMHAEIKYEDEIDELLGGLGPRYTDWPGNDPLPVNADMLPGIVPGFKTPFRMLPYGVKGSLGIKEGTTLKRLARRLPPHFALGRSRQHQGLAVAMEKLWEKSCIAKIALKRGVLLTTSERIAAEIKKLTGGIILSRNKKFIVFYRGKDFLSAQVREALAERERLAKNLLDEEEQARIRASSSALVSIETEKIAEEHAVAGTLVESLEATSKWTKKIGNDYEKKMIIAIGKARQADIVRNLEKKIDIAEYKVLKAERALAKVEESLKPTEQKTDNERITEEERFMFRKLGRRMKAFLLLGRRGVFDGTVENMHLHWKYRELVKVILNAKNFAQVKHVALSLEAESGGVLVSVDKVSKGYAIVLFRGKDYHRPSIMRPKNLLTKRKALARFIELQRHEALSNHISLLHRNVGKLKAFLGNMEGGQGDDELCTKPDLAYSSGNELDE